MAGSESGPRLRLRGARSDQTPSLATTARTIGHRWVRRLTLQRSDGGIRIPDPPPPRPAGAGIGPPDFVGVGAQRAGTSRWFRLISAHPEVASDPEAKELHFFDRFFRGGFADGDVDRYHEYFPRREGQIAGEWTPLYASAPWVPALLASAAPEARLLFLVRDPVERLASGLQHNTKIASEQGMPMNRMAPVEAFARGLYHCQLAGLLQFFDRSQILVQQYERCLIEPLVELRRTFEFIGVRDVDFVPSGLEANPNPQPYKPKLDAPTRVSYAASYADDVRSFIDACPEIELSLWPNFVDLER